MCVFRRLYACMQVKRVFIRLSGSADAALLHPTAFRHKRTIYLSDLPLASERTGRSENRDLYQMHVDKERRGRKKKKKINKRPADGRRFHLGKQQR